MPKIVDHEEYREELIWACFSIFADVGYARCTVKQLAARAGVTSGTLYHYFKDKRTLFEAVVHTVAEADLVALRRVVDRGTNVTERLRELGDYLDRNEEYLVRQNRIWCEVMQMADYDKDGLRDLYARYRAVMASVFQDRDLSTDLTERLTTLLVSLTDGLIFHRQFDPGQSSFRSVFATFADFFQSQADSRTKL